MARNRKQQARAQAKQRARKSERRTVAARERAAERHAHMLRERQDDRRYVHRVRGTDGSSKIHLSEEAAALVEAQLALFEEKFGRPPGPRDYLFFDPDSDVPAPMPIPTEEQMVEEAVAQGLPESVGRALHELGYIVTEENQHMFSLTEIEAWEDAVERHGGW